MGGTLQACRSKMTFVPQSPIENLSNLNTLSVDAKLLFGKFTIKLNSCHQLNQYKK